MADRVLDAVGYVRVMFTEGGHTQEFTARVTADRMRPLVVNVETAPPNGGGRISLDAMGVVDISRRAVPKLPPEIEATIEEWIAKKRLAMMDEAVQVLDEGSPYIKINKTGKVAPK